MTKQRIEKLKQKQADMVNGMSKTEAEYLQIPQVQVLKQRQFALNEFSSRLSSAQRSKIQRELNAITVSL